MSERSARSISVVQRVTRSSPEVLRAAPGEGPIAAAITDVIFLGDVVRYAARCDRGATLVFSQRREPGGSAHAIGARVALAIDPADIVFLAE